MVIVNDIPKKNDKLRHFCTNQNNFEIIAYLNQNLKTLVLGSLKNQSV